MATTAAILDLVSIDFLTHAWVDWSDFFWWLIGGDWRKVPFDDQHHRSANMAATAAILDLVSVDHLTNTCIDWSNFFVAHWGSSILTIFHFSLNLTFHTPTDNWILVVVPSWTVYNSLYKHITWCHMICWPNLPPQ
jgi:hypothetical protein